MRGLGGVRVTGRKRRAAAQTGNPGDGAGPEGKRLTDEEAVAEWLRRLDEVLDKLEGKA